MSDHTPISACVAIRREELGIKLTVPRELKEAMAGILANEGLKPDKMA